MPENKIPKRILKALDDRVKAAEKLRDASCVIQDYCESIGMNINEYMDKAALCSSWMMITEPETARAMTLSCIEEVLEVD